MKQPQSQQVALPWKTFWSRVTPVVGIALIFLSFIFVKDGSFFGDEGYHRAQIEFFLQHKWIVGDALTTIPGLHALLTLVSVIVGEQSLAFLRFQVVVIGAVGIVTTWAIAKRVTPKIAGLRTMQVLFLPILFPFFSLLYTDVPALTLVLLGLLFFVRKQYLLSLFFVAVSVLVRQNNIVWLGCFALAWLFEEHGSNVRAVFRAVLKNRIRVAFHALGRTIAAPAARPIFLFLLLCAILFTAFLIGNGGIAIGDKASHPFPGLFVGNIIFALMLTTVFFLPILIAQWSAMGRLIRGKVWVVPLLVTVFIVYMLFFTNSHWYNQGMDSVFLRNRILTFFTHSPELKTVASLTVLLGLLLFLITPVASPWRILLPVFSILFLLPSWLIEQRYTFVTFTMFILLRRPLSMRTEILQTAYQAIFTGWIFWMVASRWLFL